MATIFYLYDKNSKRFFSEDRWVKVEPHDLDFKCNELKINMEATRYRVIIDLVDQNRIITQSDSNVTELMRVIHPNPHERRYRADPCPVMYDELQAMLFL